jgi:hypothetical protein
MTAIVDYASQKSTPGNIALISQLLMEWMCAQDGNSAHTTLIPTQMSAVSLKTTAMSGLVMESSALTSLGHQKGTSMTAVISSMTRVGSAYNLIVNASPLTPMESHASHGLKCALHTPLMVSHASQNPIPSNWNACGMTPYRITRVLINATGTKQVKEPTAIVVNLFMTLLWTLSSLFSRMELQLN